MTFEPALTPQPLWWIRLFFTLTWTPVAAAPTGDTTTPFPVFFMSCEFTTTPLKFALDGSKSMALRTNPYTWVLTIRTDFAESTRIPFRPVPIPLMSRPIRVTLSVAAALTTIAFVPLTRTPPSVYSHLIVSAFVIVTPPNPPGSRQLISPFAAVFEIAPANVLHGAVRLHGLASSPTPETHVRVAWADAEEGNANAASRRAAGRALSRARDPVMRLT
jgi:hypothetical protein